VTARVPFSSRLRKIKIELAAGLSCLPSLAPTPGTVGERPVFVFDDRRKGQLPADCGFARQLTAAFAPEADFFEKISENRKKCLQFAAVSARIT